MDPVTPDIEDNSKSTTVTIDGLEYKVPVVTIGPRGDKLVDAIEALDGGISRESVKAFFHEVFGRFYSETLRESMIERFSYDDVRMIVESVTGIVGEETQKKTSAG